MTLPLPRPRAAAALLAVVLLGVASRRLPLGLPWWDKSLGDGLYAGAVYLALALLRPAASPARLAGITLALCTAIELFQLTGLPARYAAFPAVRWLLGTRFAWHDLACYLAGVALLLCVDILWLRARATQSRK